MSESARLSLPIPPHDKILDLLLLINVLEEIQDTVVKAFRIGGCVAPGENGGRCKRKSNLQKGELEMRQNTGVHPCLSCDISD
jgi:hypothetical protein